MKNNFTDVYMNPVRQRIVQYLLINKSGTVSEISSELSDVPRPSIYRHIKVLFDNNCIEVTGETQKRGTVEKTYSLVTQPLGKDFSNNEAAFLIQSTLFSLIGSFSKYFESPDCNPQKDLLSVSMSTLMLSDEEMMDFFLQIGNVYNSVINNKPDGKRKPRSITFISSPSEDN